MCNAYTYVSHICVLYRSVTKIKVPINPFCIFRIVLPQCVHIMVIDICCILKLNIAFFNLSLSVSCFLSLHVYVCVCVCVCDMKRWSPLKAPLAVLSSECNVTSNNTFSVFQVTCPTLVVTFLMVALHSFTVNSQSEQCAFTRHRETNDFVKKLKITCKDKMRCNHDF